MVAAQRGIASFWPNEEGHGQSAQAAAELYSEEVAPLEGGVRETGNGLEAGMFTGPLQKALGFLKGAGEREVSEGPEGVGENLSRMNATDFFRSNEVWKGSYPRSGTVFHSPHGLGEPAALEKTAAGSSGPMEASLLASYAAPLMTAAATIPLLLLRSLLGGLRSQAGSFQSGGGGGQGG